MMVGLLAKSFLACAFRLRGLLLGLLVSGGM
jgi:hypothetical protein